LVEASSGLGPLQGKFGPPKLVKKSSTLRLNKDLENFVLKIFVQGCERGEEYITQSNNKG